MASSLQTSGVLSSYFQTSIWENQTIKNGKSHFRATGLILSIPRKESLHMFESTTNLSTVKTLFRGAYGHRQKKTRELPNIIQKPDFTRRNAQLVNIRVFWQYRAFYSPKIWSRSHDRS